MSFSLWTSALAFFVIEGYALQDQLSIGHATAMFMFGTACLTAGACIGLFAILMAIGLAVSAVFGDERTPQHPQGPLSRTGPIDHRGDPRTYTSVKPNATRRPAFISKSERHVRRLGS
jgi:hypothetical protein